MRSRVHDATHLWPLGAQRFKYTAFHCCSPLMIVPELTRGPRRAVVSPVHTRPVPVWKFILGVERECAFESTEAHPKSGSGTPAETAGAIRLVEPAAILHASDYRDRCGRCEPCDS